MRRALVYGVTFLVAGGLVGAFAALPPIPGFLVAVAAALGWCACLERRGWPFTSHRVTIDDADRTPMRSFRPYRPLPYFGDRSGFLTAALALIGVTTLHHQVLGVTDPTIVALSLLLVVVAVGAVSSWRVAVATSMLAFLSFNFFFLPPVGTLIIADAQHWVALFTLLAVSLVASYLSSEVRHRANAATTAEIARHSAELKSSLLASLGHDLKTPLTALTVAANNLNASWLTDAQRLEQAALVHAELRRLNRLFQNLIEMARIESHAVIAEPEWVPPSEIIAAAMQQVAALLGSHRVHVDAGDESVLVRLDPRLTSAALAHVLENAAQHSPPGSSIWMTASTREGEIRFVVRDSGVGLVTGPDEPSTSSRPHRRSGATMGTGMGLTISRGLLLAENGRLWGENDPAGGAVFTLAVPVERRAAPEPELELLS